MLRSLAVLLCLLTPSVFAERPSAAKRVFVPIVGHTAGFGGTEFVSELFLLNRGTSPADVTLVFTPSGADGRTSFLSQHLFVPAGWTVKLEDVVAQTLFGSGTGALEIVGDVDSLVVRSSALETLRDVGTSIPSATEEDAVGLGEEPLILMPVTELGWARTNIGIAEIAGHAGIARIRISSAFEIIESIEIPILPFSHMQVPVTSTDSWGVRFAAVDVIEGDARVIPYASLVENISADAMYIRARRSDMSRQVIPIASHFNNWWSGMWYVNVQSALGKPDSGDPPTPMTFYPAHDPGNPRTYEGHVGIASYINSAVFSYFEFYDGAIGQIEVSHSKGGFTTTRMTIPNRGDSWVFGHLGQNIDPVPVSHAVGLGESVDAIGAESTFARRTNIGVTEVDGHPVTLRIAVLDAHGVELGSREVGVAARGIAQLSVRSIVNHLPVGRVRFTVTGGEGRILAYASVIENVSGDPQFVLAE